MKDVFARVISRGGYDLADMLKKIDQYHIEGQLTDEEKEELYAMARKAPTAQFDYAGEIQKLWTAIRELQAALGIDSGESSGEEWPEYVQPTGAHDAYHTAAQVTFHGQHYRCLMDNCVWSPDVLPSAWEIV